VSPTQRACALLLFLLTLAACGAAAGTGDPARGEQLFRGAAPIAGGNLPACIECHPVTPGDRSDIGPGLAGVADRAATTVPEQTAEEYLRQAIVRPDAYLAGGFQEGIMPRNYDDGLSPQELDDLVAYLLTLREAP
jgi:cytochrome c